jgi:hypothetical protein
LVDRVDGLEENKADKSGGITQEITIIGELDGVPAELTGLYDIESIV